MSLKNKYHAKRTYSNLCGRWFSSIVEAKRGEELHLLMLAGEIAELEYQPTYLLSKKPKITYTPDFRYVEHGEIIVEDVKGVLTRDSRTKIAWIKEKYGIEVKLVRY
jgi:hypothetical protein